MEDCILFQAKLSLWHTQLILISIFFRLNSWFRMKMKDTSFYLIMVLSVKKCLNEYVKMCQYEIIKLKFMCQCWIKLLQPFKQYIIKPFYSKMCFEKPQNTEDLAAKWVQSWGHAKQCTDFHSHEELKQLVPKKMIKGEFYLN